MKKFFSAIWKLLTSLEVAVVLVLILAAFQVLGALIPQDMGEEFYLKAWDEGTYHALRDLGILNIFRGPVFIVPALLLGLNLLCCSIDILRKFFPKGITARYAVSALYHLAILAMFAGFFTTFLVAYGGELTIKPGESVRVPFAKGDTRWAKLAPKLGLEAPRFASETTGKSKPFALKAHWISRAVWLNPSTISLLSDSSGTTIW